MIWMFLTTILNQPSLFSSDLKKRDVVLQDDSTGANSVTLTLWGELAENFNYHNRVITIKGAKVIYFLL